MAKPVVRVCSISQRRWLHRFVVIVGLISPLVKDAFARNKADANWAEKPDWVSICQKDGLLEHDWKFAVTDRTSSAELSWP